jgi:hypothetical protein
MIRRLASVAPIAVALFAGVGCAHNPDRLPHLDRQFYENLETDKQKQEFLRLKESERQGYLDQAGLWAQWTALSSEEREAVKTRSVEVGYKEFTAHMAWGPAADVREGESNGRVVRYETFIRCTSGPKAGGYVRQNIDCDGTSSEVQLAIENGLVTEIKYLD